MVHVERIQFMGPHTFFRLHTLWSLRVFETVGCSRVYRFVVAYLDNWWGSNQPTNLTAKGGYLLSLSKLKPVM